MRCLHCGQFIIGGGMMWSWLRRCPRRDELIFLPDGGMLIDTPGIRELQLWDDEGIVQTFQDVEEAATRCRFTGCGHQASTPGCAVQAAIESGALPAERLENWHKLARELSFLNRRKSKKAQSEEKKRWKEFELADRERYGLDENAEFRWKL